MFTNGKQGIKRKLGVAGAVAGAVLLATQAPAAAEVRWLEHGWDTGTLDVSADRVSAKDYECDGNGVYVIYNTVDSGGWHYYQVWDENGCRGEHWWEEWAGDDIEGAAICENRNGCSEWIYP